MPVATELAFAVSQTTGEVRLRWDPCIRHQHLVDADRPARAGSFGGGWRFLPETRDGVEGTRAMWKYFYAVKLAFLRPARSVGLTRDRLRLRSHRGEEPVQAALQLAA